MRNISQYPARLLTPEERALVAEWFATAGDIAEAYMSNRRSDNSALLHRVVIIANPDAKPSHLVHAPSGRDIWMVLFLGSRTKIQRYPTLRAALNSVRYVLVETTSEDALTKPQ